MFNHPKNCDPLDIISDLRSKKTIENAFLNGYCYDFARLLRSWCPGGTIFFLPDRKHYVYFFNKKYWDITGVVDVKDHECKVEDGDGNYYLEE